MDELLFIDDDDAEDARSTPEGADRGWVVLVVDDDRDVHKITCMALRHYCFRERPLHLLACYSGAEALAIIATERDIALVLLDVVMEHEDAGMSVLRALRAMPDYQHTQIVVRTAAGGYRAPAAFAAAGSNGFVWKSELDKARLEALVTQSLTAYCAASAHAH